MKKYKEKLKSFIFIYKDIYLPIASSFKCSFAELLLTKIWLKVGAEKNLIETLGSRRQSWSCHISLVSIWWPFFLFTLWIIQLFYNTRVRVYFLCDTKISLYFCNFLLLQVKIYSLKIYISICYVHYAMTFCFCIIIIIQCFSWQLTFEGKKERRRLAGERSQTSDFACCWNAK